MIFLILRKGISSHNYSLSSINSSRRELKPLISCGDLTILSLINTYRVVLISNTIIPIILSVKAGSPLIRLAVADKAISAISYPLSILKAVRVLLLTRGLSRALGAFNRGGSLMRVSIKAAKGLPRIKLIWPPSIRYIPVREDMAIIVGELEKLLRLTFINKALNSILNQ